MPGSNPHPGGVNRPVSEGWPFHQFENECLCACCFLNAVDVADIRVVQGSKDLRLSLEPREPIRIAGKRLGQDLERDLPVQLGIGGLIDLAL